VSIVYLSRTPESVDNIDIVIRILHKTILSPAFCIVIPLAVLSLVKSTAQPAYIAFLVWAILICVLRMSPLMSKFDAEADLI
jgi:hypothetical protein